MTLSLRSLSVPRRAMLIGAAALILTALIFAASMYFSAGKERGSRSTAEQAAPNPVMRLPPPDLLRPLSPEEAVKANAERPMSTRPDTASAAFRLKTDPASSARALECLAQAVYYEAATETAEGQQAVAQVVLNRMRHPGYPSSICGVVYQGSERSTGCQFSFTCDGSLARVPAAWAWKRAQGVAKAALDGAVFASVGHATHYHANYVVPYWADSLDKAAQIGRHIFYRFKGSLGSSRAFSQRYSGSEPLPPPAPTSVISEDVQIDSEIVAPPMPDPGGLKVFEGELIVTATTEAPLADTMAGSLLGDDGKPERRTTRSKTPEKSSCQATNDNIRLKPLGTAEMQSSAAGC